MSNNKTVLLCIAMVACFYGNTHAQTTPQIEQLNTVEIEASTFAQKKNVEGKIIQKLDSIDLVAFQGQSLSNALNSLQGVYIAGSNSATGSVKGINIRGGNTKQVLILIDGVPVNDPSSIDNSFDLNLISLDRVESVELMKGASSTLYGSGAAVGVINIITKKPSGDELNITFNSSLRTEQESDDKSRFNRVDNNLIVSGSTNGFDWQFQGALNSTSGISEAYDENGDFEKDGFESQNINIKLGQRFSNSFKIDGFYSFQNNQQDFDGGAFIDSDINTSQSKMNRVGLVPNYKYRNGSVQWQNTFTDIERSYVRENTFSGTVDDSSYETESFKSDLFNQVKLGNRFSNITGASFEYQNTRNYGPFEIVQGELYQFRVFDVYSSFAYRSPANFGFDLGARYNYHNIYEGNFTYDVNGFYELKDTFVSSLKLFASYATSYNTPSLYQLFSQYGNTDLEPETSENFEIGLFLKENNRFDFSVVYFNRVEENPIQFYTEPVTYASMYVNGADQTYEFSGVELALDLSVIKNLGLNFSYTYTELDENKANNTPKDLFRATGVYNYMRHRLQLNYQYNGSQMVQDFRSFPAELVSLDSYSLLDLNYNYKFSSYFNASFGVNNLLNENYFERLGYSTMGTNFILGLNFNL